MMYMKVFWLQDRNQPVELLSEIGDDGYEVRKVNIYRDGRQDFADETRETGKTFLGLEATPPLEEIQEDEEFEASLISKEEFDKAWKAALASHGFTE